MLCHTPPQKGIAISWGVGWGSARPKKKKSMKLNPNFQRGWGGGGVSRRYPHLPSVGEVWIFSGTTQF